MLLTYMTCSTDESIKEKAAHGGTVTSLLLHALDTGMVNCCLVTKMDGYKPLRYVATTRGEILESQGSHYISNALPEPKYKGEAASVCLPCQTKKSTASINIGLFCTHAIATEWFFDVVNGLGIREPVKSVRFRVGTKVNDELEINGESYKYPDNFWKFWGMPTKCVLCREGFNYKSDVSVGDACRGWNLMMIHTEKGFDFVHSAIRSGKLNFKFLSLGNLLNFQPYIAMKHNYVARIQRKLGFLKIE